MSLEIREGVELFNTQKFFEAHEALEAIWLKEAGEEKLFLHGLIQVAAAFHHQSRDNLPGFKSLLEKGCAKLKQSGGAGKQIDLPDLFRELEPWRKWIRQESPESRREPPPIPKIKISSTGGALP